MLVWADGDHIDYHPPEGEYGASAQISFTLTDVEGDVLAHVQNEDIPMERSQPNGPGCPPVCFFGRLTV